jgi:hypothetical protein
LAEEEEEEVKMIEHCKRALQNKDGGLIFLFWKVIV